MSGTGQALDLQFHQAFSRKSDHFPQHVGIGALFEQRTKRHHLVGQPA
jgi:hypothetical protein